MKLLILLSIFAGFGLKASIPAISAGLQEKSKTEKKYIAVYFCGSDWCAVCHKYKKETLETPVIDSILQNDFIYYTADFPQRAKLSKEVIESNEFLAEKLNKGGIFPLLVITDEQFEVKHTFKRGAISNEEMILTLNNLKEACSK